MPQFILALDDKSAPFAYHNVIHTEDVPANTNRGRITNFPFVRVFYSVSELILV